MKKLFTDQKAVRNLVLKSIEDLDTDALNFIPEGFNNNIVWNFAHILVTQQLLVYKLSGINPDIPKEWISKYRIGTKPESKISSEEIAEIKSKFIAIIDQTEKDYNVGIFKEFVPYTTSYNIELTKVEDALNFNNVHEGVHLGYILAQRRFIK